MNALKLVMTTAGLGRFTAAQANDDIDLTIATVGLTAAEFVAAPTLTALPSEFRRLTTVAGSVEAQNIVHITVTDDEPVTYTVTGFGLYLADGTLFAAYSQPGPIAEKSVGSLLALAIDVAFPAAGVDQLTFGSTNFLNPPATTARRGVVRLATSAQVDAGISTLDAVTPADLRRTVPIGVILLWFGEAVNVPSGWAVCNGQTVARSDGGGDVTLPDLRDRVPVGAGGVRVPGEPFGATSVTVESGSSQTAASIGTTTRNVDAGGSANGVITSATLNDPGHDHSVTVDVTQPSLALLFIMKV